MKKKHTSNKPILYRPKFKDNIPGYPGYYVFKFGKVYTRNNVGVIGLGYMNTLGLWRELTPAITNLNRCKVSLRDPNGKKLYIQVSRLVAKVYIPNPENKPCVCHKDNNPCNNRTGNLYWGTQKENIEQCIKDGRNPRWKQDIT